MSRLRANKSILRQACRRALALAALLALARMIQLANAPPENSPPLWGGVWGGASLTRTVQPAPASSELAQLYAHCPMAAVVDLQTVAASPAQVDALLPPYRPTADRVPHPPLEPAVPRIRYPTPLRAAGHANPAIAPDVVHMAQAAPTTATSVGEQTAESRATLIEPSPNPSLQGRGSVSDEWLVDPNEWYTPEERERLNDGDAEGATDPVVEPRSTNQPSSDEPPASAEWKLLTPEDMAEQAATQPAPKESIPASEPEPQPTSDFTLPPGSGSLPDDDTIVAPTATEAIPLPPPPFNAPPLPSGVVGVSDADPSFELKSPQGTPSPAAVPIAPPPLPQGGADRTLPLPLPKSEGELMDPHLALFAKTAYPSARECATCHEDIYHEWSASAHAYAAVSPMFHKFEQKLNDLTQGTVGYFCIRCHAPVATALCASRAEPLWNLPEVAREGITCIACHRVQYVYGKSNGERRIEPGDAFAPVFGGIGGEGVAETIHRKEHFKVKTSPDEQGPGQNMHAAGIYFEPLTRSEFCTPCHQVAVHPGIKLEVVWEQYRASPACKKGIECQDCHMGRVPGLPLGYNIGPVAKIADKTVNDHRKKTNHIFYGPNYSIAHPGVFPFHLKASRWTIDQWLAFDWRAGWGTDEFENRVADGEIGVDFPPVWAEADARYDAREIIDENLAKLNHKRELRVQVMENGSRVEGPFFDSPLCRGQDVRFHYIITNTNEGHNLLTASLGAQPQYWANVVLIGPDGRRLWETGYTDSYGDVANIHSIDVRHKRVPYDWQLFNLQTMFLITGAKGTDREFPVPVNVDIDQLPFIRPGAQPISTINHPPFIRMESQSLAPLGLRRVPYRIPAELVQQPGTYRLSFRMRSRAEPIYLMRFCDATPEMERSMNEWMVDVHPMSVEFEVK